MIFRCFRQCLLSAAVFSLLVATGSSAQSAQHTPEAATITLDTRATAKPFPHFWEEMFGSGRATLTLRDSYRRDMRAVKEITGFQYVRFHDILDDSAGV